MDTHGIQQITITFNGYLEIYNCFCQANDNKT